MFTDITSKVVFFFFYKPKIGKFWNSFLFIQNILFTESNGPNIRIEFFFLLLFYISIRHSITTTTRKFHPPLLLYLHYTYMFLLEYRPYGHCSPPNIYTYVIYCYVKIYVFFYNKRIKYMWKISIDVYLFHMGFSFLVKHK